MRETLEKDSTTLASVPHISDIKNVTFDPFDTNISNISTTHTQFDIIREECHYYEPIKIKDLSSFDNSVSIIHINARSMVNKIDDIATFLVEIRKKVSIVCISETWLHAGIEDRFSLGEQYKSFYKSRQGKAGGGSAIFAELNGIQTIKEVNIYEFKTAEVVTIQINSPKQPPYIVCQIYRPPEKELDFLNELEQFLSIINSLNVLTYITGDFNIDLFSVKSNSVSDSFFTLMCSYGFLPTISRATRIAPKSSTLIDNIFTNDISRILLSGIILTDISDHLAIFVTTNMETNKSRNISEKRKIFDYKQIDNFKLYLVSRLDNLNIHTNPEAACEQITEAYKEGITQFSKVIKCSRKNTFIKPWMTPALLCSVNHKNSLFSKKIKHPSSLNIAEYNKYRNCLSKAISNAKKLYYKEEFEKHNKNPKKTWEILNDLLKQRNKCDTLPSGLQNNANFKADEALSMAEKFNEFFTEIGETLKQNIAQNNNDPLENIEKTDNEVNSFANASENDVEQIILQLKDVGAGIDGINSKIFKLTYKPILPKLCYFFNLCLATGTFPKQLKIAVVKPIFKNGDCDCLSNYRPISILPIISKVLEKLIYTQMINFINEENIISKNQFGFRKNHSTYMPIMLIQDYITKALEKNDLVVGIFLDLSKAFDTVDHKILVQKLNMIGFRGVTLKMLKSYLMERTQIVQIKGVNSSQREVKIGVPQGSILGPLLFIIYINDIVHIEIGGQIMLYADDTALFFKHKDQETLQYITNMALSKVTNWLKANYLTINTSKTLLQVYTMRKTSQPINIHIDGVNIKEMKTIKYLGVLFDADLKFTSHINSICSIISRNIGSIARARRYLRKQELLQLYNSLIFPYINYCCFIWGSNYDERLRKLSVLQKRSMRLIEGIFPPQSATPIFKKYNVLKVKEVAYLQTMLIMHKYLMEDLPPSIADLLHRSPEPIHPTRRLNHFETNFSKRNYRLFTFACLGPNLWNDLIASKFHVDEIPRSKIAFKRYLKNIFLDNY